MTQDKTRPSRLLVRQRKTKSEMQQHLLDEAIEETSDPYFPSRDKLLGIYAQTIRDAHLRREIRTAIISVTSQPFGVFNKKTKQIDTEATRLLKRQWLRQYIQYMLEAEFFGHSLIEFGNMKESDSKLVNLEFQQVHLIPRQHVCPVRGLILARPDDPYGIPYRGEENRDINKWLLESEKTQDLGILEVAAREVIWKNYSRSDWSRRSEKFGMPLISIFTSETDESERQAKLEMGEKLGSSGAVVLDDEDELKYLESSQTDAYKIYEAKCRYCDEQDSKLINGVVIGEGSQGGSRSKEEVGERLLKGYTEDRLRDMEANINDRLIPFLIEHGYPLENMELRYFQLIKLDKMRSQIEEEQNENVSTQQNYSNQSLIATLDDMYNQEACCS